MPCDIFCSWLQLGAWCDCFLTWLHKKRFECGSVDGFILMHKPDWIFKTLPSLPSQIIGFIFFLFIRGPSSTLHGDTAQPFPRLPGHHPRNRRGPGHPGGREYGGGRWRADAQSAGGPELWHPQRHGVCAGSYQDWQGELPHMVIKDGSRALLTPPLPTLWTAACSNLWRIHRCFYETFQRASLDSCLCFGVQGQPLLRQYCAVLFTGVLSLHFVCVFKAGPWTDNYARVPKFFTGLSVNPGHLYLERGSLLPLVSPL